MKGAHRVTVAVLLGLLVAAALGLYLTSGPAPGGIPPKGTAASPGDPASLDQHYLETVRALASRVTTPQEQREARAALDAADHDLDLQYAYALQLAAVTPVPETPAIHALQQRIARINAATRARQFEIQQIKRALGRVRGPARATLQDQLDLSQAELHLLGETLGDATNDLIQAGGDPTSRLQDLNAAHVAASKAFDTFQIPAPLGTPTLSSLLARWPYWRSLHRTRLRIEQAGQAALAEAARLSRQRDQLARQLDEEEAQQTALARHELTPQQIATLTAARPHRAATRGPAAHPPATPGAAPGAGPQAAEPTGNPAVALIRQISADRSRLRLLDHRVQSMKSLASAYAAWDTWVAADERPVLHGLIVGGFWVVLLLALALLLSHLGERLLAGLSLERQQKATLQTVLRVGVRVVILLVILMLLFGRPRQLSTVLGLASAGLAIALQGFLLSFLGWFVLMGRHGIRVGDRVEINANAFSGVRGEVIEITLFRTVLLEASSWTEPGHLTGRQVAFMNMYAVNGYYFNFSTSGQWLWDELQVAVPAGQTLDPLIEQMRAVVARETEGQVQLAEHDWQRVSQRYGTDPFSAQPTVNVRPTETGVIAIIRYMTRAEEQTATHHRLNRELVSLFHHGERLVPGDELPRDAETTASTGQ